MKKLLVLLLASGVLLLGVTLLAAHEGEQRETVTAAEQAEVKQGEHSRGEQHVKCVLFCAELGMPLGVLEGGYGADLSRVAARTRRPQGAATALYWPARRDRGNRL